MLDIPSGCTGVVGLPLRFRYDYLSWRFVVDRIRRGWSLDRIAILDSHTLKRVGEMKANQPFWSFALDHNGNRLYAIKGAFLPAQPRYGTFF